jgi:hypothetical protein
MSDFIVDTEAEAGRLSSCNRKTRCGKKESNPKEWQNSDKIESRGRRTELIRSGFVAEAEEGSDWPDLHPLIQELGNMPRNNSGVIDGDAGTSRSGVNGLGPLMRELTSAPHLRTEDR